MRQDYLGKNIELSFLRKNVIPACFKQGQESIEFSSPKAMPQFSIFTFSLLLLFCSPVRAKYSGGSGEPNDPYLIATPNDLNSIGLYIEDFNKCFLMTADINLAGFAGEQFNIIGPNSTSPFTGIFDGNDFTISNFTWDSNNKDYIGIFGRISCDNNNPGGDIRNIILESPDVNANSGDYISALVGYMGNGHISNCKVIGGSIKGNEYVGALLGRAYYVFVGGPTGYTRIFDCSSTSTVIGNQNVGGLIGGMYFDKISWAPVIENCWASGNVSGTTGVGGLVGFSYAIIENSYATGDVNGLEGVGGLVGVSISYLINCHATGSVNGGTYSQNLGGLLGSTRYAPSIIDNSYATGSVTAGEGSWYLGGLCGSNENYNTINNSYATGPVNGKFTVGGLCGKSLGDVNNCYATGDVNGNDFVGGLIGDGDPAYVTNSFWDVNTSDCNQSAGGIGLTTIEMQTKSTFTNAGWDFVGETVNGPNDVWTINENIDYPKLVWKLVNFTGWYEVDFADFSFLADHWLYNCNAGFDCRGTDLDFSGKVDFNDLDIFCNYWLKE